ncbi:hypothetical protein M569_14143, partial [Genlisea aurea]
IMIFLLITCFFSFLFFFKTLSTNPLPHWAYGGMRLVSLCFWEDLLASPISSYLTKFFPEKKCFESEMKNSDAPSLLDLPELVLESILEKLPPSGLCKMGVVCTSLRDRCMSDHLWEKHMEEKWGRLVGRIAHKKWQLHTASDKKQVMKRSSVMGHVWNLLPLRSSEKKKKNRMSCCSCNSNSSVMSCYLALHSGNFWFPAQVYNRENGHSGFLLSCYDAELSYDRITDTFSARYPPHGWRASAVETGITWDRVRASSLGDASPHDLHASDCLNELRPGDHVEIQWRRYKEFPYGWWYGVIGHLESCDGNLICCRCRDSETVIVEFNHYSVESRWRRTAVSRKEHREEGNEADGFYGGIRKLKSDEEIAAWKNLWPAQVL